MSQPAPEDRVRSLAIWSGPITVTPLKGGVSNASFVVEDATGKYVARVGEDYPFHQVSRVREGVASQAAFEAELSPEVIHLEKGLSVIRHIAARTYGEEDVRANMERCVEIVQRCHRDMGARITGQGAIFWVFQILRDYGFTLSQARHRHEPDIPRWMEVVAELEDAQVPLPIVFGHHDLLPSNFMDDGSRLWLIDWEYGAFGTAMFDLANIAANNSFDTKLERRLLRLYFGAVSPDTERAFYAMKAASALREALWGMVSELHLHAPGVDYVAYAAEYLGRFERVYADYKRNFG
jgi:thiamine kinase-like enzyme